jgi:formamidopyrimidine-DNA glycosylase
VPELPDVNLYVVRLRERTVGARLEDMRIYGPSVLRSIDPPPGALLGKSVRSVERLGKRIVYEFGEDLFMVLHLMISGRLGWSEVQGTIPMRAPKVQMAAWQWSSGRLTLTEASTRKRATVQLARGPGALEPFRRSGADLFALSEEEFASRLRFQNRTLKRALTDPNSFDGVGNAYSDEILFAARLSPVKTTGGLSDEQVSRLLTACRETLGGWRDRLIQTYPDFPRPGQITAFRPEFNVHGRYGQPCRVCGAPVQHIVYAENETNYCAVCQNEGRLLADRSLSRLLKEDWPKMLQWEAW